MSVSISVSCLGFHMKEVTHTHTHTSLDSVLQQLSRPFLHDSSLVTQLLTLPDELTGGETERKTGKFKEKRTRLVHEDNIYYVLVFQRRSTRECRNTRRHRTTSVLQKKRNAVREAEYKQT